jgi:hypothetical protein
VTRAFIAIACVGLAWGVVEPAHADRVFTLERVGPELGTGAWVYGIDTLPDGSFLYSDQARRRIVRVFRDGRRAPFALNATLSGPGSLLVQPDGTVLVADSNDLRETGFINTVVRRIASDGSSTVVAGRHDFPVGDGRFQEGAPATTTRFGSSLLYLAREPDGGFLVSSPDHNRVFRVHPDGTMTTAAGNGDFSGFTGEGGPAVAATLPYPRDIASTPDGSFIVISRTRVLRVTPDGTIRALAGDDSIARRCRAGTAFATRFAWPTGVEALRDGSFVVADGELGCLLRVSPTGVVTVLAGRGPAFSVPDAWRSGELSRAGVFWGDGGGAHLAMLRGTSDVVGDPLGWLLMLDGARVAMLAPYGARRLGVAIRGGERVGSRLRYVATAAGRATLEALRGQHTLATTRSRTRPGTNVIRLPEVGIGLGRLVLRVRAIDGGADRDELGVVLGGQLPIRLARRVLASSPTFSDPDANYYVDRCKRMARRRVDCLVRGAYTRRCKYVVSLRLSTIGLPKESSYACKRPGVFDPHPRPSEAYPVPLL